MKLLILPEAEFEAAEAAAWYDDRKFGLGDEFLAEVSAALDRIRADPQSFSRMESYTGEREVRRNVLRRFPYLIIFVCNQEQTLIVAITHVRRKPMYWMDRLVTG